MILAGRAAPPAVRRRRPDSPPAGVAIAPQAHWAARMSEGSPLLTTNRKALTINLDPVRYGTFAEIGAGQEVARMFFQAGGAAGTVAKSMSAYDMAFSDAIYGKAPRYVSRERLLTMLEHEYRLLHERLTATRGADTTFFVFANTVVARSYQGNNDCHGWLGLRFQHAPGAAPSDIILHVRMWDKANVRQQEALGIAGVNLIYGAFHYRDDPPRLIRSLADNLGAERLEVDMFEVSGPGFPAHDNRLLSLHLVQCGLTDAVMFGPSGQVLQSSRVLRNKPVLVERGSFRPVTLVHLDMLERARAHFHRDDRVAGQEIVELLEITMKNLLAADDAIAGDFLDRVDLLGELGHTVLVSNHSEYYRLTAYFRRFTTGMIGVAMGANHLLEIFDDKYYENLPGGILEAFGRLFRNDVKLYVHPARPAGPDAGPAALVTARNLPVAPSRAHLYAHLCENRLIEGLEGYNPAHLEISARDILRRISSSDTTWEQYVPGSVAATIKARGLFGYRRSSPKPATAQP